MILDIVLIFLVIIAIFKGLRRGLIVSVFSLLSFFVFFTYTINLYSFLLYPFQITYHISARWLPILAFILVFVLVVLLLRWAANLIRLLSILHGWGTKQTGWCLVICTSLYHYI
jgi:membrane protein required for colicin V production